MTVRRLETAFLRKQTRERESFVRVNKGSRGTIFETIASTTESTFEARSERKKKEDEGEGGKEKKNRKRKEEKKGTRALNWTRIDSGLLRNEP